MIEFEDDGGRSVPVEAVEFDWHELARIMGEDTQDEPVRSASEIAAGLLRWMVFLRGGQVQAAHSIGTRVLALSYLLGLTDGRTLEELAAPSKITRAAIDKQVSELRDRLGIVAPAMRSEQARGVYHTRAKEVHGRKQPNKRDGNIVERLRRAAQCVAVSS